MREVLALVEDLDRRRSGAEFWRGRPVWAQLCLVGLSDAGMYGLGVHSDLASRGVVEERVSGAYELAKLKAGLVRVSFGARLLRGGRGAATEPTKEKGL